MIKNSKMVLPSGSKWVKVGDFMLIGEYHHNIDEKGRLIIPAKFRDDIGNSFVLTRGLDGCLFVYSMVNWDKIIENLKILSFTKKDARTFMRFFLSGATVCEFDKQGRINIQSSLLEYAEIKKECAIIGVNDRLEVWSLEKFENMMNENAEYVSDISEHLFDMNLTV